MHGHKGRSVRHAGVFLDVAHLILGTAIVILAVLSFINPEGNLMLFPLVFLLSAVLNGISCVFQLKTRGRDKRKFRVGVFQLLLAVFLGFLGILSAVSLWF
ncbi:DUF6637 family protein [Lacrimispora sp. 210928-DFI.3.58]|uniref:DUF6637 family protein n=1 Tax=Lacrimispora sp. 210928-DFI.3.58 TaxID=2883214 RepID=UPI0015B4DA76|nr:DUF6637 family protein [Lacrimispora sp. 210928-DFI.3.58]MCB7320061.1 hypothetical protein [Lacrimispora sp. 210928-DFI.3.58]